MGLHVWVIIIFSTMLFGQQDTDVSECSLEHFTQFDSEHIINEVKEPFRVREVKGQILSVVGDWPKDIKVLFEILKQEKNSKVIKVYSDPKGLFVIPDILEGTYCFKATVIGWQSVMGVIIVSEKAPLETKIVLKMRLGV